MAGETVVVAGYGWCGKGVAMRAKGLGAKVIVTEIDPVRALEAAMDGFSVMTMEEAAPLGDLFITVTGCEDVVTEPHFLKMKDGAICCNAGHFECEVAVAKLRKMAVRCRPARAGIEAFELPSGKTVYILAEGRLVNLAAGDGHPAEIMDMSFSIQALCAQYLAQHRGETLPMLNYVPAEIDREVAERKLRFLGISIDHLTKAQQKYLDSWNV